MAAQVARIYALDARKDKKIRKKSKKKNKSKQCQNNTAHERGP